MRKGLKSISEINRVFNLDLKESPYEVFVPEHIIETIKEDGLDSILAKQFIPSNKEIEIESGHEDPIGDQKQFVAPQLIHRYHNRVLFTPTTICPVICRYCFRKKELSQKNDIFKADFEKVMTYLLEHKEVEEIIFSGGDPFMLSASKLSFYLSEFSKIKTIKYIRFHTRTPVSLPSAITQDFLSILESYKNTFNKITTVIHINHLNEITDDVRSTIKKLSDVSTLLSQSVLLKGVNDSLDSLYNLVTGLEKLGVRPYYLHHPDIAKGAMHFYLSEEEGLELYKGLRQRVPGWMLPQYIIDSPDGSGKRAVS